MGPVSLVPSKPGGIFLATRLGCVSGLATCGIVCESGLVRLDPPDNRVPEFVASDPKLWDVGNRLVGVDTALGLPSSVYLGFTLQVYKSIDRRSLAVV
jgi:hypothetical protein